jgi:hypothetical protein
MLAGMRRIASSARSRMCAFTSASKSDSVRGWCSLTMRLTAIQKAADSWPRVFHTGYVNGSRVADLCQRMIGREGEGRRGATAEKGRSAGLHSPTALSRPLAAVGPQPGQPKRSPDDMTRPRRCDLSATALRPPPRTVAPHRLAGRKARAASDPTHYGGVHGRLSSRASSARRSCSPVTRSRSGGLGGGTMTTLLGSWLGDPWQCA